MKKIFQLWTNRFDAAKGLYSIEPLLDAVEYSISSIDTSGGADGFLHGDAFRPTINSFMFANAQAISKLAALAGDKNTEAAFAANAAAIKSAVQTSLWNDGMQHFVDRYKADNASLFTIGISSVGANWPATCRGLSSCRILIQNTSPRGSMRFRRKNSPGRMRLRTVWNRATSLHDAPTCRLLIDNGKRVCRVLPMERPDVAVRHLPGAGRRRQSFE